MPERAARRRRTSWRRCCIHSLRDLYSNLLYSRILYLRLCISM
jgi:hypothetical protein